MKPRRLLLAVQLLLMTISLPQLVLAQELNPPAKVLDTARDKAVISNEIREFAAKFSQQRLDVSSEAEEAVARGDQLQVTVQQFFAQGERLCAERFFVNSCIEDLRQQRRLWQDEIRAITQYAKAYLRQSKNRTRAKSETASAERNETQE